jgi:hypothetical protein
MSSFIASMVYILAATTSLACALLLARGYFRSRVRLLMWSSLFFAALTADNILLFFDLSIFPQFNLALWRHSVTLIGLVLLLFGLIWDSE